MISPALILVILDLYMVFLFLVTFFVERWNARGKNLSNYGIIYALSLAVYATAWTFYGNVGFVATNSYLYLAIYIGASLAMLFGWFIFRKLIRIKNEYGVTSTADFLSARYGKSHLVGALAALIAILGITPYFALQFKAVFTSFEYITSGTRTLAAYGPISIYMLAVIIFFTLLFGFRNLDESEKHPGLVAVVALQSIVKFIALGAAGIFVTFFLFHGVGDMIVHFRNDILVKDLLYSEKPSFSLWITHIILSMSAIMFLPRQFRLAVVENNDEKHIRTAAWFLPAYFIAILIFILPIALGGLLKGFGINVAEFFALILPVAYGHPWLAALVFLGGFSAAISMIMVSSMAITGMVANNLVLPFADKFSFLRRNLLQLRLFIMLLLLLLGYALERIIGSSYMLVEIGIVSFAAIFQLAPAMIGGLFWEKGNRAGAAMGLVGGLGVWLYCSLLPVLVKSGWVAGSILIQGPWGIGSLRPEHLLGITGIDPLASMLIMSAIFNVGLYILGSLVFAQSREEELIALNFVNVLSGRQFVSQDASEKNSIVLEDKRKLISAIFNIYLKPEEAEDLTALCIKKAQLEDKKLISLLDLMNLSGVTVKTLAGYIGSASASRALEKQSLFTTEEYARLSEVYAKMVSDLKVSPKEFVEKLEEQKALAETKSNFMAIASHEMRTPLAIIKGDAELALGSLSKKPENKELAESLEGIEKNSDRLLGILHNFLDATNFEENKIELKNERFDLVELVKNILSELTSEAQKKNLKLEFQKYPERLEVFADQGKVREVVSNLVNNAIHYTEQGKVSLAVENLNVKNQKLVKISVQDTGLGIAPENQTMLFKKFSTVGKTFLHSKEYGSGLGLYISKMLSESMGGSLNLEESLPGKGSRFSFTLPVNTQ